MRPTPTLIGRGSGFLHGIGASGGGIAAVLVAWLPLVVSCERRSPDAGSNDECTVAALVAADGRGVSRTGSLEFHACADSGPLAPSEPLRVLGLLRNSSQGTVIVPQELTLGGHIFPTLRRSGGGEVPVVTEIDPPSVTRDTLLRAGENLSRWFVLSCGIGDPDHPLPRADCIDYFGVVEPGTYAGRLRYRVACRAACPPGHEDGDVLVSEEWFVTWDREVP